MGVGVGVGLGVGVFRRGGKQLWDGAQQSMWRHSESRRQRRYGRGMALGRRGKMQTLLGACTLPERLRKLRWVLRR